MALYEKYANAILTKLGKFSKSSKGRYGVPFILFFVVGSFGLKEFTEIRFKYRPTGVLVYDEAKKIGINMKKPGEVTIETVYETIKDIDIEHWENKRGPRPWEESS